MRGTARHLTAERGMRSILGREQTAELLALSTYAPVPVAGTPFYVIDGIVVPRMMGAGFTSLSDLISEATAGKAQSLLFAKLGTTTATGGGEDLWTLAGQPGAGATPAALPGGTVPDNTTAGSLGQTNAAGGDTLHITTIEAVVGQSPGTLVLMDRLWHAAKSTNSNTLEAASGVPTRYTGTAAAGNVAFPVARTTLGAVAHTHTMNYVDNAGNAAEAAPVTTGNSSCAATRVDISSGTATMWFMPLNAGDTGLRNITSWTLSAAVTSGQIDLVIARPLAFVPCAMTGIAGVMDGINSAFNLTRVLDGACLSFIVLRGASAVISTYGGRVQLVSG